MGPEARATTEPTIGGPFASLRRSVERPATGSAPHPIRLVRRPLDEPARDTAFAAWVIASLVGILVAFVLAKATQVSFADRWHPAAGLAAATIVASVALTLAAGVRFQFQRTTERMSNWDRAVLFVAVTLVIALGWASLVAILSGGTPPHWVPVAL